MPCTPITIAGLPGGGHRVTLGLSKPGLAPSASPHALRSLPSLLRSLLVSTDPHQLAYGGSSVDVALFGGHVTSWKTVGADGNAVERLWLSSLSAMDGTAPIRGGIPIAWPQFANDGPMPLHGFARERAWRKRLRLEPGTWLDPSAPPRWIPALLALAAVLTPGFEPQPGVIEEGFVPEPSDLK